MIKSLRKEYGIGALVVSLIVIYLSTSCDPVSEYLAYTRAEPAKASLIGAWFPDEPSLQAMWTKGGYDKSIETKLILRENGTFDLINMPDWWPGFGKSHQAFNNYSGNWTVFQNTTTHFWE